MVDVYDEVTWEGLGLAIMGVPGVVSGDKGALFGVCGFFGFVGKYFQIPAQGYGIHLSTRVNLYSLSLHPILHRKHQVDVE